MNIEEANTRLEKLDSDLRAVFEQLKNRVLPSTLVKRIHSHSLTEDGKTLMIMLDMDDGRTVVINACPGEPLRCVQVD